jgi:hypothetical protein
VVRSTAGKPKGCWFESNRGSFRRCSVLGARPSDDDDRVFRLIVKQKGKDVDVTSGPASEPAVRPAKKMD